MSCQRVIDGLWETCLLFLQHPTTEGFNYKAPCIDTVSSCVICIMYVEGMDFFHLVASKSKYHCTQCHQSKNALSSKWSDIAWGWSAFGIHVFSHLFTPTHSLKWIWLWLMNNHGWSDLPFNQYLFYVYFSCTLSVHPNREILKLWDRKFG